MPQSITENMPILRPRSDADLFICCLEIQLIFTLTEKSCSNKFMLMDVWMERDRHNFFGASHFEAKQEVDKESRQSKSVTPTNIDEIKKSHVTKFKSIPRVGRPIILYSDDPLTTTS